MSSSQVTMYSGSCHVTISKRATTNWSLLPPSALTHITPLWAAARTARCHRIDVAVASRWTQSARNYGETWLGGGATRCADDDVSMSESAQWRWNWPQLGAGAGAGAELELSRTLSASAGFIIKGKSSCQSIYSYGAHTHTYSHKGTGWDGAAIGPGQSSHISIKGSRRSYWLTR